MTHDLLRTAGFPEAEEPGNMFQFFTDATETSVGNRDRDLIQTINLRLQSLEDP